MLISLMTIQVYIYIYSVIVDFHVIASCSCIISLDNEAFDGLLMDFQWMIWRKTAPLDGGATTPTPLHRHGSLNVKLKIVMIMTAGNYTTF